MQDRDLDFLDVQDHQEVLGQGFRRSGRSGGQREHAGEGELDEAVALAILVSLAAIPYGLLPGSLARPHEECLDQVATIGEEIRGGANPGSEGAWRQIHLADRRA